MSEIIELQRQINALRRDLERARTAEKLGRRWEGTIANGATAQPFGNVSGGTFAGLIIVQELTAGQIALFLTGGATMLEVADFSGNFTATSGTASKANVYLNGTFNVTIQNNLGSSILFYVQGIPVRAAS